MKTSLIMMLSAVAVAALLASPASARSRHHGYTSSPFYGAYGAYGPSGYNGRYRGLGGPYTPNSRIPSYDFQDGGGNKG
jgi:hypothetical protein